MVIRAISPLIWRKPFGVATHFVCKVQYDDMDITATVSWQIYSNPATSGVTTSGATSVSGTLVDSGLYVLTGSSYTYWEANRNNTIPLAATYLGLTLI